MKVHFRSKDSAIGRWQQRGVDRLRQALRHLQQLLAVDRQPDALALIPIRAVQPRVAREPHRRNWRD
jgi:hypothetical protein